MSTGRIKAGQIKLGDNADNSKNFVIKVPAVADGTLTIERENGTTVASIDANGVVSTPKNVVAFHALSTTATFTIGATITATYTSEIFDTTTACNISTGRFQPTVSGYYQMSGFATVLGTVLTRCFVTLEKRGSSSMTFRGSDLAPYGPNGSEAMSHCSALFYLNGTTDYVYMTVYTAGTTITAGTGKVDFQGVLVAKA